MVTITASAVRCSGAWSRQSGGELPCSSNTPVQARKATPATLSPPPRCGSVRRLVWRRCPPRAPRPPPRVRGHLGPALQTRQMDRGDSGEPERAARSVHGHVSPADHQHVGAKRGSLATVHSAQEVDTLPHARLFSPGMPSLRLIQAPGAANTALNPDWRRLAGSATRVPVLRLHAHSEMCWIS